MTDLSHSREKDKINPVVFYTSAGLILLFSLTTILFRDFSALWIGRTLDWVSKTFGWYYLLAATLYIVFVVCIACSRFGSVKLGPEQSKPEFSLLSWAAMLFAAGIGIDLMFFSVAEPVTQYMQPPEGAGQTIEAARQAMVWTLFHYGLTGWSMYALMGMALGYFSYRYNLPLTIRSALYPIFGKRINGPIGHSVNIAAAKSDRQSFALRPYAPTNPDDPTAVPLPVAGFLAPRTRRATATPAPLLPLPGNRPSPSSV
jgi:choline/glycine/proline betaine transport protein